MALPLPEDWTIEGLAVGERSVCVVSSGIEFCAEHVSAGQVSRSSLLSHWFGESGWEEFPSEGTPSIDLGAENVVVGAAFGWHHTCAVLSDGSVKCWGQNNLGELDLGDRVDRGSEAADMGVGDEPGEMGDALRPLDLGAGSFALEIVVRSGTTCALLEDNSVTCWEGLPRADLDE